MFAKNKNKIKYFRLTIIVAVILTSAFYFFQANAAITQEISYQGKLTDDDGVVVPDEAVNMIISIYDAASDGNRVWTARGTLETPTAKSITPSNGIFSTLLGESGDNALTLDFSASYWLGVTVGADAEMTPRKKIGANPYAFNTLNMIGSGYINIDNTATAQDALNLNYNPASGTYDAVDITYGSAGGTGTALRVQQSGSGKILELFDSSTSVMSVIDGGNIGIGTTNPSQKLTVYGSDGVPAVSGTTQNGLFRIWEPASYTIDMGVRNSGYHGGWIQVTNVGDLSSNAQLDLNPNGGNVSIGSASGVSALLNVGSNASISSVRLLVAGYSDTVPLQEWGDGGVVYTRIGRTAGNVMYMSQANYGSADFEFRGNYNFTDQAKFPGSGIWNSSGNVGIGSTAPEGLLEIQGAEGNDSVLYLDADDGDDNADTWILKSLASGNDFTFTNHTSEWMRLTDGGLLGIGTTDPITALEIPGSTTNSSAKFGTFEIQSYAVNNGWLTDNSYFNGADFKYRSNGTAERMYFIGGGVRIGAAASGVAGNTISFTDALTATLGSGGLAAVGVNSTSFGTYNNFVVNANATANDYASTQLNSYNSSTKALVIQGAASQSLSLTEWQDSSGNILSIVDKDGKFGIGNTNPQSKIHITPATAAALQIDPFHTDAGDTGELRFLELAANGTNYIGFKAPDNLGASNSVYTFPSAYPGVSGYVLSSTDAGVLSWEAVSGGMSIGGSITSATQGSILFAGALGVLAQDNANFFWDDGDNHLGIGTTDPGYPIHVVATDGAQMRLAYSGSYYADFTVANDGDLTIAPNDAAAVTTIGGGADVAVTVDNNGLVGIGTTAPARILEVYAGDAAASYVRVTGGETYDSLLELYADQGDDNADKWGIASLASDNTLRFQNNAVDLATLSSAGLLGIGTTAPSQQLTVSANAIIGSSTSLTETLNNAGFTMGGDDLFVAGMMGVEGNVYTDGSFIAGASTTISNGSISQSSGETLTIGTTAANLTFSTTSSGNIILSPVGSVGIGTTNPSDLLDVAAAAGNSGISISRPAGSYGSLAFRTGTSTRWYFGTDNVAESGSNAGTNLMLFNYDDAGSPLATTLTIYRSNNVINFGSKVGIGTSNPLSNFGVIGNASIGDNYGAVVAPSSALIVEGNVGIGITNPGYKLDTQVTGATYAANFFNDGNNASYGGLQVQAGADAGTGTTVYMNFLDGDGTLVGYCRNVSGTFSCADSSDIRTKTNVVNTSLSGIDIINQLRVVDFNRLQDPDGPIIHGFVAQEVQEVYPFAVSADPETGILGISRDLFVPLIVKGMQEQQTQIGDLQIQSSNFKVQSDSLELKVNENLTSVSELGRSINEQLLVVGKSVDWLNSNSVEMEDEISEINSQLSIINSQFSIIATLESQMEDIKKQTQANTDLLLAMDPQSMVYKDVLGNVDLLKGKLTAEGIVAGAFTVKVTDEDKKTIGEAVIVKAEDIIDEDNDGYDDKTMSKNGEIVLIKTKAVTENSKILATPIADKPIIWSISEKKVGESFTIKISQPAEEKIKFNWWIVESR